jgi:pyruvate formate lyase activating enzyme
VNEKTACVCYFGGDPASQIDYLIHATRHARKRYKDRILRFCWETNGSMHPKFLKKIVDLSLRSGGTIKFDIKAWNEDLNRALCGVSNRWTLMNFKRAAALLAKRPEPPLLIASTLLIPGYVDEEEVKNIAGFIASINPDIPYSLLAYAPQFYMNDLPTTSQIQTERCFRAAQSAGLKQVKIGNLHLLNHIYY